MYKKDLIDALNHLDDDEEVVALVLTRQDVEDRTTVYLPDEQWSEIVSHFEDVSSVLPDATDEFYEVVERYVR